VRLIDGNALDGTKLSDQSAPPEVAVRARESAVALERLRDLIAQGEYVAGDRLPPERRMIEELGIGRSVLRRALDALEREGTIWRHVGKGTFVAHADPAPAGAVDDLARRTTPVKMMRARLCLEPAIAREAAMNASAEALQRLRAAMERARAAHSWADYEAQDDAFHRAIAEASDNLPLLALFDHLNGIRRAVAWGNVERTTQRPPDDHSSFAEHAAIADAIAARSSDGAFEAMRRHLRSVAARLFPD
jgi:DNA-binding FadR family transcriptional regulator